jgi:hypothetical protein
MVGLELELIKDRSNMLVCSVRQMTGKKKRLTVDGCKLLRDTTQHQFYKKNKKCSTFPVQWRKYLLVLQVASCYPGSTFSLVRF